MLNLKIKLNDLHKLALWQVLDNLRPRFRSDEMAKAYWDAMNPRNWSDKSPSGLSVLSLTVSEPIWERIFFGTENLKINATISGDDDASRVFRSLAARLRMAKDEAGNAKT